jgi:hypothetical protein
MNAASGLERASESARRLVAFRIDPRGELANEGHLTSDERSGYEALINAANFI